MSTTEHAAGVGYVLDLHDIDATQVAVRDVMPSDTSLRTAIQIQTIYAKKMIIVQKVSRTGTSAANTELMWVSLTPRLRD